MPRAKQFQHLSAVAVNVLARLEAKKAVKEQLRASGNRRLVPHREIVARTKQYLAIHPELREQALATAWELSVRSQSARINAVLFHEDRRVLRKPRSPVSQTGSANAALKRLNFFLQLLRFSVPRAY
jgi:hypothetical protein